VCALLVHGAAKAAPPAAESEARAHYRTGMTKYELGEFEAAIAEFKKAYEITNAPPLLFNIAQAHRLAHDADHALYFYRMYLRLLPDAPNRADVESLIQQSEASLAEQRAAAKAAEKPPAEKPSADKPSEEKPSARPPEEKPAPIAPVVAARPELTAPSPPSPRRRGLILGLSIGGAAVVVGVVVGLAVGLSAPGSEPLPPTTLGVIKGTR
jgi:tetratricopeptide (TPR) repeat protein